MIKIDLPRTHIIEPGIAQSVLHTDTRTKLLFVFQLKSAFQCKLEGKADVVALVPVSNQPVAWLNTIPGTISAESKGLGCFPILGKIGVEHGIDNERIPVKGVYDVNT